MRPGILDQLYEWLKEKNIGRLCFAKVNTRVLLKLQLKQLRWGLQC